MNSKENSTTAPGGATIDDVQSDLGHLSHLLDTTVAALMEMDFGVGANRNHQLDRVNALVWIGRDIAEKACKDIDPIAANGARVLGPVRSLSCSQQSEDRLKPVMDPSGWSVTDMEQAYAGLVAMANAGNHILCQPRSTTDASYIPGAAFIENTIVDWIDWQMTALIDHAKSVRFPDPHEDDRRVALLLRWNVDYPGMSVAKMIAMATAQAAKAVAA